MEDQKLIDIIEDLNRICKQSFGIGYSCGWEAHSYADNTPFPPGKWVYGKSFEEVVLKAYRLALEWEKRERIKAGMMTA
jgi:hypothetical protein